MPTQRWHSGGPTSQTLTHLNCQRWPNAWEAGDLSPGARCGLSPNGRRKKRAGHGVTRISNYFMRVLSCCQKWRYNIILTTRSFLMAIDLKFAAHPEYARKTQPWPTFQPRVDRARPVMLISQVTKWPPLPNWVCLQSHIKFMLGFWKIAVSPTLYPAVEEKQQWLLTLKVINYCLLAVQYSTAASTRCHEISAHCEVVFW